MAFERCPVLSRRYGFGGLRAAALYLVKIHPEEKHRHETAEQSGRASTAIIDAPATGDFGALGPEPLLERQCRILTEPLRDVIQIEVVGFPAGLDHAEAPDVSLMS